VTRAEDPGPDRRRAITAGPVERRRIANHSAARRWEGRTGPVEFSDHERTSLNRVGYAEQALGRS
jgi:hypothetical protein